MTSKSPSGKSAAPKSSESSSSELRTLVLSLPATWSINQLIRASYHLRNQRREMLKAAICRQMAERYGCEYDEKKRKLIGFRPLRFAIADALIGVPATLRDNFELPASLKIEFDALQECGVLENDGPRNLGRGIVAQRTGEGQWLRLRLRELSAAPEQPELDL